jgi:hypothetical protein
LVNGTLREHGDRDQNGDTLIKLTQNPLHRINRLLFEKWFTTLLAHPRGHIVNDHMIPASRYGVAYFLARKSPFAVKAFHFLTSEFSNLIPIALDWAGMR